MLYFRIIWHLFFYFITIRNLTFSNKSSCLLWIDPAQNSVRVPYYPFTFRYFPP